MISTAKIYSPAGKSRILEANHAAEEVRRRPGGMVLYEAAADWLGARNAKISGGPRGSSGPKGSLSL